MPEVHRDPLARLALPVMLALFLLGFAGIDRGLWTPDEPREAEIGREMMLNPGVVPTLNGETFIEKPPLYYWLVAASYRLAGGPVPAAARTVSVLAGFLTLLVVFSWGRRARSTALGLVAAVMLATSLQFVLTAHWILVDPLLMLFTTIAAWAAWELLQAGGGMRRALAFYAALALALWTKGLIGPVLVGAGLGAYLLVIRRFPWRSLRPGLGLGFFLIALGALAFGIYRHGGWDTLREWAWVNHVLRFVHPAGTGHELPFHYYLWTTPFALLPWIVPLADALRPSRWREATPGGDLRRFCLVMAGGMLVVLSASATKRGIYLMPVLPLACMGFAVNVLGWLARRPPGSAPPGRWWTVQAILLGGFALAPPLAAWIYTGQPSVPVIVFLLLGLAACGAMLHAARSGSSQRALAVLGGSALLSVGAYLALSPAVLDPGKDMAPFVEMVDRQLPPGETVYLMGADETLLAIVPFVTGRRVVPLTFSSPRTPPVTLPEPPPWVLVQTKGRGRTVPALGANYRLVLTRNFGPERNFSLWVRTGA